MAKDPAFLFYSSDFLSGVQDLTMEERGQYITLLSLQHQKGHLSEKIIKLSVGNAAADVMAKFRQDSAGLWYNERLDIEKQKRQEHSRKQAERAKEGWKKRKSNATADATALPLEDVNENINEDEIINEYKEWTDLIFDRNDQGFDTLLYNERLGAIPEPVYQHWILDHLDLLHRYPKMRPKGQQSFRRSALKHLRENYKKELNGKQNGLSKKDQHTASLVEAHAKRWGSDAPK